MIRVLSPVSAPWGAAMRYHHRNPAFDLVGLVNRHAEAGPELAGYAVEPDFKSLCKG